MSKITKNLNTIYKKAIHRPISKDGYVLYTKVDGYTGASDAEPLAEKSAIYKEQSQRNYNSASNIRRLFITGNCIYVQYYASYIVSDVASGDKFAKRSFNADDDIFKAASEIVSYDMNMSKYMMDKTINNKAKEPDKVVVTGKALGIIANPWVMGNIEEIYIDWTFLLSEDVKPYFPNLCNTGFYNAALSKSPQINKIIVDGAESDNLLSYFMKVNSDGVKADKLRDRFPRLRTLALISNLSDIMNNPKMIIADKMFNDIEAERTTWFDTNKELIQSLGGLIIFKNLTGGLQRLNVKFVVKDNIYKFDKEKLKPLFESHDKKIEDYYRNRMYGSHKTGSEADLNIVMTELESLLVDIEESSNDKTLVKKALIYAIAGINIKNSELKELFSKFTKPNRDRLAGLIGLKL